jgi:hypothetical protein
MNRWLVVSLPNDEGAGPVVELSRNKVPFGTFRLRVG